MRACLRTCVDERYGWKCGVFCFLILIMWDASLAATGVHLSHFVLTMVKTALFVTESAALAWRGVARVESVWSLLSLFCLYTFLSSPFLPSLFARGKRERRRIYTPGSLAQETDWGLYFLVSLFFFSLEDLHEYIHCFLSTMTLLPPLPCAIRLIVDVT